LRFGYAFASLRPEREMTLLHLLLELMIFFCAVISSFEKANTHSLKNYTKRLLKRTAIGLLLLVALLAAGLFVFLRLSSPVTKNLDAYVYELPFQPGASYEVVQGYGGLFSHKNTAALDFRMPVGTPVYAAREGVVYGYKDDSDEGGPFPKYKNKANYLMIRHRDGSFACYWHLKKDGVVAKKGAVAKGQLIGYSGATGFLLRPHLHFSVKRKLAYEMDAYTKTTFNTTDGVLLLKRGRSYMRPENLTTEK
jgi:murein DD-endopeptidase MepM/ murein hydrolase activator NlpD